MRIRRPSAHAGDWSFILFRGDFLIKYILIGGFICLVLVVIFALLKVASNFDDEVEQFYNNFSKNDGLNEEFDYYDNMYKDIVDKHKNNDI